MRKILLLGLVLMLSLLAGCATVAGDENHAALGTHKIKVSPDGKVDIDTRTLRGSPEVLITKPDGTKIKISDNSLRDQLQTILDTMK